MSTFSQVQFIVNTFAIQRKMATTDIMESSYLCFKVLMTGGHEMTKKANS